jgi:hypothetical protein
LRVRVLKQLLKFLKGERGDREGVSRIKEWPGFVFIQKQLGLCHQRRQSPRPTASMVSDIREVRLATVGILLWTTHPSGL